MLTKSLTKHFKSLNSRFAKFHAKFDTGIFAEPFEHNLKNKTHVIIDHEPIVKSLLVD